MVVASDIRNRYDAVAGVVEAMADRVRDTVRSYCSEQGYLFEDRVKDLESVAEKIETGRYANWSGIDDLYACTIIISLPSEEDDVLGFLSSTFDQVSLKRRTLARKPPDVFRFDATRFIGRLRHIGEATPEGGYAVHQIRFEVQVKGIFDYAWARTNHALVYKSQGNDWRKLRLSAQLKAVAEMLETLVLGFEQTSEYVADGHWPVVEDKGRILQFFQCMIQLGYIPREVAPKSWSRFADNVHKVMMAYENQDPTRMSEQGLGALERLLSVLGYAVLDLGPDRFPRSISLFQFVVGILGSSRAAATAYSNYYLPVTEDMQNLFGSISIPGRAFDSRG